MKKHEDFTTTTTSSAEIYDDASFMQSSSNNNNTNSVKSKLSSFAKRLSVSHDDPSTSKSQKKEMEATQRRLESVAKYERDLDERVNDESATEEQRERVASEKRYYEGLTPEKKEDWVVNQMALKDGWGAGVYGEGVNGPGMWYR
jgi:CRISPR/Cas system CSM-associated protein Csm5 (group 7 of RAMP superfamily)